MAPSRPPICSRSIAACVVFTLTTGAWAATPAFRQGKTPPLRGDGHGTTEAGETHTPPQRNGPKAPTQFNPDPGSAAPSPAVMRPQVKPLPKMPDAPLGEKPATPPPLPPELPKPGAGSPFDLGFPGAVPPPLPPGDLRDRPSLFPEDFLYLPRFDNQKIPDGLKLPRRGVRSQRGGDTIFHYREYPMGQEGLGLLPRSEPIENRWKIPFPKWQRYMDPSHETPYGDGRETLKLWHPYEASKLKGDAPIIGQEIFANITLKDFALFEYRRHARLPKVPNSSKRQRPKP